MIKPPIVAEGDDLFVYKSPEQATSHLEIVDILESNFVAYDSEGMLLDFHIDFFEHTRKFLWFKWKERYQGAILVEHQPPTNCSEYLRKRLLTYLRHQGKSEDLFKNATLIDLIKGVGEYMSWKI